MIPVKEYGFRDKSCTCFGLLQVDVEAIRCARNLRQQNDPLQGTRHDHRNLQVDVIFQRYNWSSTTSGVWSDCSEPHGNARINLGIRHWCSRFPKL